MQTPFRTMIGRPTSIATSLPLRLLYETPRFLTLEEQAAVEKVRRTLGMAKAMALAAFLETH